MVDELHQCPWCHYEKICRVPEEKRTDCKGFTPKSEELIFGIPWKEIEGMQQRSGR